MMRHTALLNADAAINLILGILLMAFPAKRVRMLGIPTAEPSFYPTILAGVLFGIGLALFIESYRRSDRFSGLGVAGAVLINVCRGSVLARWLLWGKLNLPVRGQIFLRALVVILIGLSLFEGLAHLKKN